MSSTAPASRPVHPCVLSITKGSRGAEFSTWAYITPNTLASSQNHHNQRMIPNLVTASASTITIYSVTDDENISTSTTTSTTTGTAATTTAITGGGGKLRLEHRFHHLSGNVVFLQRLASSSGPEEPDALLVGFGASGARLAVVKVNNNTNSKQRSQFLEASCLLDLTSVLTEYSHGAVSEEDAIFSATSSSSNSSSSSSMMASSSSTTTGGGGGTTTLSCILGGGVAVVVVDIVFDRSVQDWIAHEPYILPLFTLSLHLPHSRRKGLTMATSMALAGTAAGAGPGGGGAAGGVGGLANPNSAGEQLPPGYISTGFGDIIASCFLMGYLEPVLVLLHSAPGGRIVSGRLARENTPPDPMYITALSICAPHNRTALLWTLAVTCDASQLYPSSSSSTSSTGGGTAAASSNLLLVVGVNTLIIVEASGRIQNIMAVNGWAKSTCPKSLLPLLRPNPTLKLSIQLDGSHVTWLTATTALLALRCGQVYVLQQITAIGTSSTTTATTTSRVSSSSPVWTLLPAGQTLGAVGQVATLNAWSLSTPRPWMYKMLLKSHKHLNIKSSDMSTGIVFAGSRLGDSMLLVHALETVQLPCSSIPTLQVEQDDDDYDVEHDMSMVKHEDGDTTADDGGAVTKSSRRRQQLDDDYERILAMEEEALYAPTMSLLDDPDVVPPSDEEEGDVIGSSGGGIRRRRSSNLSTISLSSNKKRPRVAQCTVVRVLSPSDVLVNLGPLGPSCEGPIAGVNKSLLASHDDDDDDDNDDGIGRAPKAPGKSEDPVSGTVAHVFPAGFGSSGGIALVTVPGRDDRMILAETDCLNVECIYSLPSVNAVVLGCGAASGPHQQHQQQGIRYLGVAKREKSDAMDLTEIDTSDWARDVQAVFDGKILNAGDFGDGSFAMLVESPQPDNVYEIVILQDEIRKLSILNRFMVDAPEEGGMLVSSSPFTLLRHQEDGGREGDTSNNHNESTQVMAVACSWSSGRGSIVRFSRSGSYSSFNFHERSVNEEQQLDDDMEIEDEDDLKIRNFYKCKKVVAVDLFTAPACLFPVMTQGTQTGVDTTNRKEDHSPDDVVSKVKVEPVEEKRDWNKLTVAQLKDELKRRNLSTKGKKKDLVVSLQDSDREIAGKNLGQEADMDVDRADDSQHHHQQNLDQKAGMDVDGTDDSQHHHQKTLQVIHPPDFDDEDFELYGLPSQSSTTGCVVSSDVTIQTATQDGTFLAICRQSGELEVYAVYAQGTPVLCWTCNDCAKGLTCLERCPSDSSGARVPRSHVVHLREIRFFVCGHSTSKASDSSRGLRSFCLAMETSVGDVWVYYSAAYDGSPTTFHKVPFGSVARPSDEQSRHRTKLMRKGIISQERITVKGDPFRFNRLFRFEGISGQEGLFAAVARPLWVVAERGRPTTIFHRARHAAPAGGRPRPVSGFCCGLQRGNFVVMHERVGRVGSQRLTLFQGLSTIFESHGMIPGGGLCIEKITMGVTVRRIQFIDDAEVSSSDHPLYAVLVSRELEEDQSELNDDGMTAEERQRAAEEKEAAKIKRQVEADLGGFDLEHEWVEEIQRENTFAIDAELGGAPPIRKKLYSLWIVDAADNWLVVDSYDLDEWEHGMTLQVMHLTEFKDDPGSSRHMEEVVTEDEDLASSLFIAIGTGSVDHNGEDVCSKGRVLLFELNKLSQAARLPSHTGAGVNLRLVYTKNIFHGPVATLGCLSSEGRNRLIIGAGSDVNVEQWGSNGRLTQVGFFRATMQVLDIRLFKNFFLLSDAYDSLYFLVWREADKSLTLLAKDYDPIAVYAAGVMSRGANMIFLCHDNRENLQFFSYAPGESAARGGNKLVCRADFHLGTQTIAFATHVCRSSLWIHSATPTSTLSALKQQDSYFGRTDDDTRLAVHFGTTDGGVGAVLPVSEPVYWRLAALQSVLANALPSDCGLSPRAWRLYRRSPVRGGCRSNDRKKGVVDGDLVLQYADLPLMDQEDLASAIGSTVDLILDNLLELECGSLML